MRVLRSIWDYLEPILLCLLMMSIKLILTFAFLTAFNMGFKNIFLPDKLMSNIKTAFMIYAVISYFWTIIKLTGNWIIGFIVAIVLTFPLEQFSKLGTVPYIITMFIMFAGAIVDFGRLFWAIFSPLIYAVLGKFGYSRVTDEEEEEQSFIPEMTGVSYTEAPIRMPRLLNEEVLTNIRDRFMQCHTKAELDSLYVTFHQVLEQDYYDFVDKVYNLCLSAKKE